MTEIESSLGRKTFPSSQNQRAVYTVDDPTDMNTPQGRLNQAMGNVRRELTDEEIAQFEQAKRVAAQAQQSVSHSVRERVEFLTGIGRIKTTFEMDGVKFHLQSLKSGELEEVLDLMMKLGDINEAKFTFEIRRNTLARSLYSIDNMTIAEVIGSKDMNDKLELVKSLDENLVSNMYKHYEQNIVQASRDKYAVKTDQDVEEVTEAVKK